MSTTGISDVLSQISQIEDQISQLESGAALNSVLGAGSSAFTSSAVSGSGSSSTDFADALAQAQGSDLDTGQGESTADAATSGSDALASSLGGSYGSLASSALGSVQSATGTTDTGTTGLVPLSGGEALSTAGATLPPSASTLLTAGQQQFASTLSADTGLNPGVVTAWLLAEESGSAAQSRQAAGNNDWLNVGYTDSGTYGGSDAVWSDPVSAANATAQWLQGQDSIPGYGSASTGIQAILQTVGQTPAAQISALQSSGWASGGYGDLNSLYNTVVAG